MKINNKDNNAKTPIFFNIWIMHSKQHGKQNGLPCCLNALLMVNNFVYFVNNIRGIHGNTNLEIKQELSVTFFISLVY